MIDELPPDSAFAREQNGGLSLLERLATGSLHVEYGLLSAWWDKPPALAEFLPGEPGEVSEPEPLGFDVWAQALLGSMAPKGG